MTGTILTPQPFKTERLTLRLPSGDDLSALTAFYSDERSKFYGGPKDAAEAWRDLAARIGHWALRGYGMFAMVENATGETVGLAGPVHPASFPEPEMSWLLTERRHEGKGFVTEASTAVIAWCFATFGWASMPSYVDRSNDASRAVALRLGATLDAECASPIPGCDVYRHLSPADGGMEAYA